MGPRRRRVAGTLVALALLAAVVVAVGPWAVASELRDAEPLALTLAPVAGLGALVCWAEAQRRLHRGAGAAVGPREFWPAYATGALAKLGLPAGGAGGPVVTAYAVGRETDLPFERDLGAAAVGSYLGVAGAVGPALAGAAAVGLPGLLGPVLVVAVGLVALAGGLTLRPGIARRGLRAVAEGAARALGVVPGIGDRTRDRVTGAPREVAAALDAIAGARRTVGLALALSTLGWCLSAAALVAVALSVGHPIAPGVALAVVPVASLGRLVPVPAGLGSVEAALSAVLVAVGVPAAGALAIALLHRASTDLVVAVAGALAAV